MVDILSRRFDSFRTHPFNLTILYAWMVDRLGNRLQPCFKKVRIFLHAPYLQVMIMVVALHICAERGEFDSYSGDHM